MIPCSDRLDKITYEFRDENGELQIEILEGAEYAKAVFVITNKSEEISQYMHNVLDRTTTKINAYFRLEPDLNTIHIHYQRK